MFYLFVGTIIMGKGNQNFWRSFSYVVGFCCLFIGAIELLFGFKCATSEAARAEAASESGAGPPQNRNSGKPSWFSSDRATTQPTNNSGPSITVNVTPTDAANAAGWVANNPGTVAKAANAASSASQNPFFGNSHLAGNKQ